MNAQERQAMIDRWEFVAETTDHIFSDNDDLEDGIMKIQVMLEDWGELPEFAMLGATQFMDMSTMIAEQGCTASEALFALTRFMALIGLGALRRIQANA